MLVTIDKDFGELVTLYRLPHAGIITMHKIPARDHINVCMEILNTRSQDLRDGAIVTANRNRIRMRLRGVDP